MTKEEFIKEISTQQEPLRRFLLVLCDGDHAKSDDLAQNALLKAYLSFERYEGRSQFSTWLFRIAYNCFYDSIRLDGHRRSEAITETVEKIPDNTKDIFEYQQLYMAIEKLSPSEKAAILLFYMEDKSIKEIVAILDIPSGTVRAQLSRGRKHLKRFLHSFEK